MIVNQQILKLNGIYKPALKLVEPVLNGAYPALLKPVLKGEKGDKGDIAGLLKPVNFSFGDASHVIFAVPANSVILKMTVNIITPFNGANSSINIGTQAINSLLVASNQLDLNSVAKFELDPNISMLTATNIYIFINAGAGATQGSGWVTLEYATL